MAYDELYSNRGHQTTEHDNANCFDTSPAHGVLVD